MLQAIAGRTVHTSARPGNDPPSQVLNNRHDVIMHYVIVITNSGNLKQPGRDTILIDYYYYYCYYYDTITAGVILTLIRSRRFAPHSLHLFCFICSFVSCLLCDFYTGKWRNICTLYAAVRMQIRFRLSLFQRQT